MRHFLVLIADHALITTLPFFVPALAVVTVIGVVVWRDRHRDDE